MAYDIYGSRLERGHCEVHPYVHEEYPCSVCLSEAIEQDQRKQHKGYNDGEQAYYEQMEHEYWQDMAKQQDIKFRLICWIVDLIVKLSEKAKIFKEKQYNKTCYKLSQR